MTPTEYQADQRAIDRFENGKRQIRRLADLQPKQDVESVTVWEVVAIFAVMVLLTVIIPTIGAYSP